MRNQARKIKVGVVLGQNLGQIRRNVVKTWHEMGIIDSFFHILHGEYLLKQKIVVLQTYDEWKYKESIGRNVTFEGCRANFSPHLGQK